MKKFGIRNPAVGSRHREALIADSLFVEAPVTDWNLAPSAAVNDIFQAFDPERNVLKFQRVVPEFTIDELRGATRRLSPGKALGPSGVPNEVLRSSSSPRLKQC